MRKATRYILAALIVGLIAGLPAIAAPPPVSTAEMLATLERTLYGAVTEGSVIPRVVRLETDAFGSEGDGTLTERIVNLWNEFGGGREGVLSQDFLVKCSQWIVDGKVSQGALLERVSKLEEALLGYVSRDPLAKRISRIISMTAGSAGIETQYVKLAAGTQVKVILKSPLRTNFTRPGEKIDLEVGEDVFVGDYLAIAKGSSWQAEAVDPTKSPKFDLKNILELALSPLQAIDLTPVKLVADEAAAAGTVKLSGLVISQGERPERLGFFGTGNAVDRLLPGSKNLDIIRDTAFYLTVREDVSVLAAKVR